MRWIVSKEMAKKALLAQQSEMIYKKFFNPELNRFEDILPHMFDCIQSILTSLILFHGYRLRGEKCT